MLFLTEGSKILFHVEYLRSSSKLNILANLKALSEWVYLEDVSGDEGRFFN
jgi:hypothetical protein